MKVRCPEFKDCPVTDCPPRVEPTPSRNWEHIGGRADVLFLCNKVTRTCGLRIPWVENVRCVEVIKDAAPAREERELVTA